MAYRSVSRSTLASLLRAAPRRDATQQHARRVVGRLSSPAALRSQVIGRPGCAVGEPVYLRWFSDKTEETAQEETDEKAESGQEEETAEAASENTATEETKEPELSAEEVQQAEVKDLKDQLLRSLAEQDNTRRIAQRDVQQARDFAVKSFAKALLDVSDNLTRALEAVPEEQRTDKENHSTLATLYEGIAMTESGLIKAFEMNGLVKFGEPGESFDPNKHDALYEYVDAEKEAGTIGQVMKPGFMLHQRVLRPAEVGVVKKE